jgi:hypothetical protein
MSIRCNIHVALSGSFVIDRPVSMLRFVRVAAILGSRRRRGAAPQPHPDTLLLALIAT